MRFWYQSSLLWSYMIRQLGIALYNQTVSKNHWETLLTLFLQKVILFQNLCRCCRIAYCYSFFLGLCYSHSLLRVKWYYLDAFSVRKGLFSLCSFLFFQTFQNSFKQFALFRLKSLCSLLLSTPFGYSFKRWLVQRHQFCHYDAGSLTKKEKGLHLNATFTTS